jgi:hypothetical protein
LPSRANDAELRWWCCLRQWSFLREIMRKEQDDKYFKNRINQDIIITIWMMFALARKWGKVSLNDVACGNDVFCGKLEIWKKTNWRTCQLNSR